MGRTARTIASGLGITEGPLLRAGGALVVTSLTRGCLYTIEDGRVEILAHAPPYPNGATEGSDGTVYVAQGGIPRWGPDAGIGGIQAVGRDGSVRWLSQDPISPNDLCFGPDGLLYLTDPTRPRQIRDDGRLFRCNVETGEAELLCTLPWYPNGIGFGVEDDAIYVADSGPERAIKRIPIDNGRLGKPETFVRIGNFRPDGFCFDVEGNLITVAQPGEIQTYDRNGKLIDTFALAPEWDHPRNLLLSAGRRLIVTANEGVLAVDGWPYAGLALHPFRR